MRYNSRMKPQQKQKTLDVLTIGAATRDVFVQSAQFRHVSDTHAPDGLDVCFQLGAKIDVDNMLFETGGGATNAAVTFSRFGLQTACVARTGADLGGRELISCLAEEGIDVSLIQTDKHLRTGYSIILVAGSGFRSILVYRGAAAHIDEQAIAWQTLRPQWIYLTSVAGNLPLLQKIFAFAKKQRVHVAWNPGNAELALGLKKLSPWLMQTDILLLNRTEAAELASAPPRQLDSIITRIGSLPRQATAITDGEHGAFVHARGKTWYSPALKGKRINTTGAGDAFSSAFVATAIQSGNLEKSLRAAMLNALGVITHMGAKAGILKRAPSAKELQKVKINKI